MEVDLGGFIHQCQWLSGWGEVIDGIYIYSGSLAMVILNGILVQIWSSWFVEKTREIMFVSSALAFAGVVLGATLTRVDYPNNATSKAPM